MVYLAVDRTVRTMFKNRSDSGEKKVQACFRVDVEVGVGIWVQNYVGIHPYWSDFEGINDRTTSAAIFMTSKMTRQAPKSTFGLQIQTKIDTITSWIALGDCVWSVRDAQNDTLTLRNHPGRNPDESKNHSIEFGLDLAFKSRFWTLPDRLWGHENSIRSDPIIFSFKI